MKSGRLQKKIQALLTHIVGSILCQYFQQKNSSIEKSFLDQWTKIKIKYYQSQSDKSEVSLELLKVSNSLVQDVIVRSKE